MRNNHFNGVGGKRFFKNLPIVSVGLPETENKEIKVKIIKNGKVM